MHRTTARTHTSDRAQRGLQLILPVVLLASTWDKISSTMPSRAIVCLLGCALLAAAPAGMPLISNWESLRCREFGHKPRGTARVHPSTRRVPARFFNLRGLWVHCTGVVQDVYPESSHDVAKLAGVCALEHPPSCLVRMA